MSDNLEQQKVPPQADPRNGMIEDPNPYIKKRTVNVTEAIDQSPNNLDKKLGTVRTFQSDIAGAVKSDQVSVIKIALAEKEKRGQTSGYADVDYKKAPFKKVYFIAIAVVFLMLAASGFIYYYFNRAAGPSLQEIIAPQEPEIIYSETQVAINTDSQSPATILQDIKNEALKQFDLGTVQRIFLTTANASGTARNITTNEFFEKLRTRAPEQLKRSLSQYFFIGAYSFTPHDSFIIFKVDSYDNAYAAMLEWEPYIESDIGGMFTSVISEPKIEEVEVVPMVSEVSTSTSTSTPLSTTTEQNTLAIATTTPKTTTDREAAIFQDKILQNKDTRALITPSGEIKLLYSFLSKDTLVIASSEKGLKEIIFRMTSGRIIR